MKYFVYFIILVIAAAIVGGFFVIGSPMDARLVRFDEQRISDLQNIQSQIITYWQNNGKLPVKLADLESDISGFRIPADPETKAEYSYEIRSTEEFTLCATFNLPSPGGKSAVPAPASPYYLGENWEHPAGKHCFDRKINKELFPTLKRAS